MKPYSVVASGVNSEGEPGGMIEIVTNSKTINDISGKYGGNTGFLSKQVIKKYLEEHNKSGSLFLSQKISLFMFFCWLDDARVKAFDNFARSCAGYSIATWVLGIADRHTDNIMVSKSGYFFRKLNNLVS